MIFIINKPNGNITEKYKELEGRINIDNANPCNNQKIVVSLFN